MANTLSKNNITDGNAVEAWNVTQSVDAFTGIAPYNITISGSLDINEAPITNLTASIISASVGITGSLFGVASTSSYVLADNIFQPFTNITASGDIDVTGAITASEYVGLPSGLVSGSAQIPSLLPSGVVSSSGQLGVTSIVAGTNVTISPVGGTGAVTINSSGGGGGGSIGGSITSTQVAFGSSTSDEIEGEAAFVYNKTADRLDVVNVNSTNLSGSLLMTGHILPDTDATHDIGSATFKVRDLYLDNSTLYFGTSSLSVNTSNNELEFNGETELSNNISGNALTSTSASFSTTSTSASFSTTSTTALQVTSLVSVNNAVTSSQSPKLLLFSGDDGGSGTFTLNRFTTELTGKTLGTDCFVTVTYTSAPVEPSSPIVSLSSGVIGISDSSAAGGFAVMGQIYYF